jgi:hypothetical protein
MVSSIGSVAQQQHNQALSAVKPQTSQGTMDSDGDNDGSKVGEVENKRHLVSATIGNNTNTTA